MSQNPDTPLQHGARVRWSHSLGPFDYGTFVGYDAAGYAIVRIDRTHQIIMTYRHTLESSPGHMIGTRMCWKDDNGQFRRGAVWSVNDKEKTHTTWVIEDGSRRPIPRPTTDIFPVPLLPLSSPSTPIVIND